MPNARMTKEQWVDAHIDDKAGLLMMSKILRATSQIDGETVEVLHGFKLLVDCLEQTEAGCAGVKTGIITAEVV